MKIAVDASPLARGGDGIARYLRSMLQAALAVDAKHQWHAYGRRPDPDPALARLAWRSDRLPAQSGAILALGSSLPLWAARDRPDLFWGPAHRLPLRLPARTAAVVTIHDLCWLRAPATMRPLTRRLDAWLMPRALARADVIGAVSEATAADLRRTFPQCASRVAVVPAGATRLPPPQSAEALTALGVRPPYVLYVGTQEPRKNLARLLAAFASSGVSRGAQLVIAGSPGWGGVDLAAAVDREGLTSATRLLGRCDDALLSTLYRHARFLALPSLYEGFGLPLLEAMALGTPVLTANVASMPEVAGQAGWLVDPASVDSIAAGIARLLDDDTLHARLAAAAPNEVQRYDWSRSAHRLLALFEQACARCSAG